MRNWGRAEYMIWDLAAVCFLTWPNDFSISPQVVTNYLIKDLEQTQKQFFLTPLPQLG